MLVVSIFNGPGLRVGVIFSRPVSTFQSRRDQKYSGTEQLVFIYIVRPSRAALVCPGVLEDFGIRQVDKRSVDFSRKSSKNVAVASVLE